MNAVYSKRKLHNINDFYLNRSLIHYTLFWDVFCFDTHIRNPKSLCSQCCGNIYFGRKLMEPGS